MLGVSPTKLYRLIRSGELAAIEVGRRRVIPAVALERLLGTPLDDSSETNGQSSAGCINHVTLAGRLTYDPVTRSSRTGKPYATMRLAIRPRSGDTDVLFVQVVAFGSLSETIGDFAVGQLVRVEGRLNQREWLAEDGARRRTFRVVADRVCALEPATRRTMAS
jgi:excisionase family DNA binding protein